MANGTFNNLQYMAVSGLPELCESHARCIARLALDIMDLSRRIKTEDLEGIVSVPAPCN